MSGSYVLAARVAAFFAILALTPLASAQGTPPEDPGEAVWRAASEAMIEGPNDIELRDQAQLALPPGYSFVPAREGAAVMEMMGNQTDDRFIGLILPASDANWFVTVDYEPAGYIKDDDAKEWDADELLDSLKEGTQAANEHRKQMGIAPIEVTRWVEQPNYDAASHRLVWSAEARGDGRHRRRPDDQLQHLRVGP